MQELPWRGRVDFWEAPECASNAPLLGVPSAHFGYVKAVRVDLKLFYRGVLLHPASQLYCGAGGAFGPSGGANCDT